MPSSPLAGRVCVITGASRGLGRACGETIAMRGGTVIGTYRSAEDEAADFVAWGKASGHTIEMHPCDVNKAGAFDQLIEDVLMRYRRVDALVNNAGVWRGGRLATLPPEDWAVVLETDLAGVFASTQAVLPAMLAAGAGRIVNISSVVGVLGYPGDTAYAAAKAGVNAMTKSLAKEVAQRGLAVNAVAPGPIETDMTEGLGKDALARLIGRIPLGRQGTATEVAEVVAFLLDAPLLLNGAIISLDGAMS